MLRIIVLIFILSAPVYAESIALTWVAPTTNMDSTPLTDLAGFKMYRGTATGVYDVITDIGMTLCTVIGGLTVGTTYYFVVTAYDVLANESAYSNEVSKLISDGDVGYCKSATHINWKIKTKSGNFGGGFQ